MKGYTSGGRVAALAQEFPTTCPIVQQIRSEHALIALGREPAVWHICDRPGCDKRFKAEQQRFQRTLSGKLYCSPECKQLEQRKVKRPDADELEQQMREIANWSALGKLYGVSDNAVRKWAKRYGLNLALCDGRRVIKPAEEKQDTEK